MTPAPTRVLKPWGEYTRPELEALADELAGETLCCDNPLFYNAACRAPLTDDELLCEIQKVFALMPTVAELRAERLRRIRHFAEYPQFRHRADLTDRWLMEQLALEELGELLDSLVRQYRHSLTEAE